MNKEKIYFAASIRGGREDIEVYIQLIQHLKQYGTVLTEHIGEKSESSNIERITNNLSPITLSDNPLSEKGKSDQYIYKRDMKWLNEADKIVAEVSVPSLGVGYEIGKAETMGKDILCLYRTSNKQLSAMINGNDEDNITVRKYNTIDEAKKIIDEFFER